MERAAHAERAFNAQTRLMQGEDVLRNLQAKAGAAALA